MTLNKEIAAGIAGKVYADTLAEGAILTTAVVSKMPLGLFLMILFWFPVFGMIAFAPQLWEVVKEIPKQFDYEHQMELVEKQQAEYLSGAENFFESHAGQSEESK
jgi:hypothetical protein